MGGFKQNFTRSQDSVDEMEENSDRGVSSNQYSERDPYSGNNDFAKKAAPIKTNQRAQNKPAMMPEEFAQRMFGGEQEDLLLRNPQNYKFLPPAATK